VPLDQIGGHEETILGVSQPLVGDQERFSIKGHAIRGKLGDHGARGGGPGLAVLAGPKKEGQLGVVLVGTSVEGEGGGAINDVGRGSV
jgi:hypothetical protein